LRDFVFAGMFDLTDQKRGASYAMLLGGCLDFYIFALFGGFGGQHVTDEVTARPAEF